MSMPPEWLAIHCSNAARQSSCETLAADRNVRERGSLRVVRAQARGMADAVDAAAVERTILIAGRAVDGEFDARGAGVDDQDGGGQGARSICRCANICASAQDAMRASEPSARLVSMIGTRAPSTMPAASAPAR